MLKIKEETEGIKKGREREREGRREGREKKWVTGRNLKSQCWGVGDRWISGACKPVSPVSLAHSRPVRARFKK